MDKFQSLTGGSQVIQNWKSNRGNAACRWCELHFKDGDLMETDHIDRNRTNKTLNNLMILHRHCHDERHAKLAETEQIRERLTDTDINIQ